MRFLIALAVGLVALSQGLELRAPWLVVYDEEGRPRWEITLARLAKVDSGWEGEEVEVRLYWQGELEFRISAERLTADRLGQVWHLEGDVQGRAEDLTLSCREADWEGGLTLKGLVVSGEDISLTAQEAHWSQGKAVLLSGVAAESGGWRVELARATYLLDSGLLQGHGAVIEGHGYRIEAEEMDFRTREGILELRDARLAATS
jgi:hypothetical protein